MIRSFPVFAILSLFVIVPFFSIAQPTLPEIAGATEKGINVLSWINPYDGIKSIAVQRSADSFFNYKAVGYVKNLKKGQQAFIDGHPLPGDNWYRLYIVFNSDLTWLSNRFKLYVDSATLVEKRVLPPNDSLQKLAGKIKVDTGLSSVEPSAGTGPADTLQALLDKLVISIPDPEEINAYTYIKSEYVFTNPFTGHVNMELPDVNKYHYSIVFFDDQEIKVLELVRIPESPLILDKRNFQNKGLYRFELVRDEEKLETGYITIY